MNEVEANEVDVRNFLYNIRRESKKNVVRVGAKKEETVKFEKGKKKKMRRRRERIIILRFAFANRAV